MLTRPTTHDEVYKVVQRIFTDDNKLNLTRDKKLKAVIRRRAFRRFIHGFPPRKGDDTSMGDAVNWEWIVHCAKNSRAEIVIVSRDSDYGVTFENQTFLNDWLLQEFKDRVSQQRKISLFTRLSEALKLFKVTVSKEEQQEEEGFIKSAASTVATNYDKTIEQLLGQLRANFAKIEAAEPSKLQVETLPPPL